MAANDYIAGYPPVCAISNNGADKVRVTWPAWGLDRVLFGVLTTSHFVANVSLGTPESAAILASGGTEAAGYWIDVNLTFSTTTWLSTHRYSPQRQATVYYYTSFNLARAAMITANNNDTMFLGDFGATAIIGTGIWSGTASIIAGSCWGIRANQQNGVQNSSAAADFYRMEGDLSTTGAATWQNLTMLGGTYNRSVFWWRPTSGTAGGALTLSRIIYLGGAGYFLADQATVTLATTFTVNACLILNCMTSGILWGSGTGSGTTVSHCTIGFCLTSGIANASKVVTYTNNVVFDCATCYATKTNGTYTKCAATDATGSEAGLNSLTRAQLAFWNENDNGCFDAGYGILTTSVLYHAGADTADTNDIKGNARHATTPSIGAYEGTVNAFGVAWPTAAQVLKSAGAFQTFAAATTPTYNDDNLADGNVRPVAYGVGHTGDLSNLVATDPAYAALEGTRNTVVTPLSAVPSPANGGPVAWTQLGASKVGTGDKIYSAADEAARNTVVTPLSAVPSPANGGPAAWLQLNVSRVGTGDKIYSAADEASRNTVPDLAAIPTPATGGPATWKQLNVNRTGTQDMDAVKAAYEAGRNTAADPGEYLDGETFDQFGEAVVGEYVPPTSAPTAAFSGNLRKAP